MVDAVPAMPAGVRARARAARADDARGEAGPARGLLARPERHGRARCSPRWPPASRPPAPSRDVTRHGIGHYTRVYGTRPVDPVERAAWLWAEQRRLKRETRLGIPALVHEECLSGLAVWQATTYPTPLAWGASFDPELVQQAARAIGGSMRELGIHQGLAPVLDVVRDPRWGRVDECIGEDPYLVGTRGHRVRAGPAGGRRARHAQALRRLLGLAGPAATTRPLAAGPREIADVVPAAVRDGDPGRRGPVGDELLHRHRRRADGVQRRVPHRPAARAVGLRRRRRRRLLRGRVPARSCTASRPTAARRPRSRSRPASTSSCPPGTPTCSRWPTGSAPARFDEAFVDRAVLRAPRSRRRSSACSTPRRSRTSRRRRSTWTRRGTSELARRLAEESVVLLSNDGVLPLNRWDAPPAARRRDRPQRRPREALMGCYSFANHVLAHHPEFPIGLPDPVGRSRRSAPRSPRRPAAAGAGVRARAATSRATTPPGSPTRSPPPQRADVAVVVVGDQAGLFGRGTVGEGNDCETARPAGRAAPARRALSSRRAPRWSWCCSPAGPTRSAGRWTATQPRRPPCCRRSSPAPAADSAIADVLTGAVNPSGRLPVSMPRSAGAQPYSYLHPVLGGPSDVTTSDSTPVRPFGFGLSYTTFAYSDLVVDADGRVERHVHRRGDRDQHGCGRGRRRRPALRPRRAGHDHPARGAAAGLRAGRARRPAQSSRVTFSVPTTRFAFTDRRMVKVVEPGDVEVWVGSHAAASARRHQHRDDHRRRDLQRPGRPSAGCTRAPRPHRARLSDHRRGARGHRSRRAPGGGQGRRRVTLVATRSCPGCHPDPTICRVGSDLLPRHLDLRVLPRAAGLPQRRPGELAADRARRRPGRPARLRRDRLVRRAVRAHPAAPRRHLLAGLHPGRPAGPGPRRQLPDDRDRPGRPLVRPGLARRRRHRPVDLLRRRRPDLVARHPAGPRARVARPDRGLGPRARSARRWRSTGPEHVVWNGALRGAVWAEAPAPVQGRRHVLPAGRRGRHRVPPRRLASRARTR